MHHLPMLKLGYPAVRKNDGDFGALNIGAAGPWFCFALAVLLSHAVWAAETMTYQEALEKTDPSRVGYLEPGSALERAALDRFADLVAEMSPERIRAKAGGVYAAEAYFNDTLKELVGADAIEEYLAHSMEATESVRVAVDDISSANGDYYVRWTMDIRFKNYNQGRIARSVGISHLRFDTEGKIILHKDFWDAAGGLYEYLPVLGGVMRWIKSRL